MYLSDINPELNSEINNIICESRQAKTLQERIDKLMRAWDLIPKPATQFVTPTSGLCSEISGRFKELKDYSKALEWINIALEARKTVPDGSTFLWAGIIYYELGDMENAYKYFDLTYNELRYTPFSMEDKKYWQFYKQRKEEINPKKKLKSKIRYFQTTFFVPYLTLLRLYLHRPRLLRTAGANPRLNNHRRRKPTTNPLLPLRPNRHPA